jgi:hypothetical protein
MKKLCLLFFCIVFQSCFFLGPSPKWRLRKAAHNKPFDVAIVPGLPLFHGKWDTLLKARILWSEYLYKKGYVRNILYSGNAVYTPWVESTSMALYAEKLGIDAGHIFLDTIAEHSKENLYYGYLLAEKQGFKKIVVATDPFQCAILYKFAKKNFREKITFLPIIYDSIASRCNFNCDIDTTLTRKSNFIPIAERENYKERLRGTRGKKIKK